MEPKLVEEIAEAWAHAVRCDDLNDTFPLWEHLTEQGKEKGREAAKWILGNVKTWGEEPCPHNVNRTVNYQQKRMCHDCWKAELGGKE